MSPKTIDLYGRALDGQPLLWRRAMEVVPVTAFERSGRWIRSGHYVISYKGNPVAVHCGNADDDESSVTVQFVHGELTRYVLSREMVESMLLGKVIVSEEQQAAVFEGKRLSDFFARFSWRGRPLGGELAMSFVLIVGVLVLLFSGGGSHGHRRVYYAGGGLEGMLGLLVIIFILSFAFGGLSGTHLR